MMLNYICIFSLFERCYISIFSSHLFKGFSIVNLKTTIDYNNTPIKVQLCYIAAVSDGKTHSDRPACIKDFGWNYIVFILSG